MLLSGLEVKAARVSTGGGGFDPRKDRTRTNQRGGEGQKNDPGRGKGQKNEPGRRKKPLSPDLLLGLLFFLLQYIQCETNKRKTR